MGAQLLFFGVDSVTPFGDGVAGRFVGGAVSGLVLAATVVQDFATRTAQKVLGVAAETAMGSKRGSDCCHDDGFQQLEEVLKGWCLPKVGTSALMAEVWSC
jgi:hypothetical protein